MSKRAGTFVTLRDVVEMVGPDVTRFVMLTRKNDMALDFDVDKVLEQSRDNPVFYVQYAHARIRSVARKAEEAGIAPGLPQDFSAIADPAEFALIAKLAGFPRLVETAAQANEPHRVAFYLYDLASEFHALWNKGNAEASLRFLQEDDADTTRGKLALIEAVAIVISNGLGILGVKPVDKM
jgi:arginyl-tRNA synthetase